MVVEEEEEGAGLRRVTTLTGIIITILGAARIRVPCLWTGNSASLLYHGMRSNHLDMYRALGPGGQGPLSSLSRVWGRRGPRATDCRRAMLLFSAWQRHGQVCPGEGGASGGQEGPARGEGMDSRWWIGQGQDCLLPSYPCLPRETGGLQMYRSKYKNSQTQGRCSAWLLCVCWGVTRVGATRRPSHLPAPLHGHGAAKRLSSAACPAAPK